MKAKIIIAVVFMLGIPTVIIWMIARSQESMEFWDAVIKWAPIIYFSAFFGIALNLYFGRKNKTAN